MDVFYALISEGCELERKIDVEGVGLKLGGKGLLSIKTTF